MVLGKCQELASNEAVLGICGNTIPRMPFVQMYQERGIKTTILQNRKMFLFLACLFCVAFVVAVTGQANLAGRHDVSTSHFALRGKNRGPSATLKGNVEIIVVRVSTPQHPWTKEQEERLYKVCRSSVDIMNSEARRYGAKLNLSCAYLDVRIPMEFSRDRNPGWYNWIMRNIFHKESMRALQAHWEAERKKDDTPVMFMFNSWDKSATFLSSTDFPTWDEEYSYIFCDTQMHDNYLTHELLHQYGAIDYYDYANEGVAEVAKKYFPNSDMLTVSHEIDELTAYLIGWTDELSPKARAFLKETEGKR